MRICIFGAGAIGGFLAGYLARSGADISVVARGPHLQAIRSGKITGIMWVAPGETMLSTLREHILGVKEIPPLVAGMGKVVVNPTQDHRYLYFTTEELFPDRPKPPPTAILIAS